MSSFIYSFFWERGYGRGIETEASMREEYHRSDASGMHPYGVELPDGCSTSEPHGPGHFPFRGHSWLTNGEGELERPASQSRCTGALAAVVEAEERLPGRRAHRTAVALPARGPAAGNGPRTECRARRPGHHWLKPNKCHHVELNRLRDSTAVWM